MTYKDGVYDITSFAANHPGGDKILKAAGGPLEPYWALYAAHKATHVFEVWPQWCCYLMARFLSSTALAISRRASEASCRPSPTPTPWTPTTAGPACSR